MGGAIGLLAVLHILRVLDGLQPLQPIHGGERAEEVVYIAAQGLGVHLEPLKVHVHLHTPTDGAQAAGPRGLGQCPRVPPHVGREVHLYLWHVLKDLKHRPGACDQGLLLIVEASQSR